MKHTVFSIYDLGVQTYSLPLTVQHVVHAHRYFQSLARDEKSDIGRFPSQFQLMEIAEFDDAEGLLIPKAVPVSHGLATSYLGAENAS